MTSGFLSGVKNYFKSFMLLINQFFKTPDMIHQMKIQYQLLEEETLAKNSKLLQIFLIIIFSFFFIPEKSVILDHTTYVEVTILRGILIFLVFVPVYLGIIFNFFGKYLQLVLFFQFALAGLFLGLSANLIATIPSLYHDYIALNLLLIVIYNIFRIKAKYLLLLTLVYLIIFNVCIFHPTYGFAQKHLADWEIIFYDLNAWFITLNLISYLFKIFLDNIFKRNFIINYNLGKQKAELREAVSIKDRFISLIAHDLKNLISSQYVLSNMLAQRHMELTTEKRDEFLKLIDNGAYRTIEILDEIMIWARAQQNRIVLRPKDYLIETLIMKTTGLLEQSALNKEISITTQIANNIHIVIDENSFNTILRNIIGNAIKFSNRGSEIIIKAQKLERKIIVQVIDFGTGMSDNTKANLFKVDHMITTPGTFGEEGTGLGLILCQELARLNHGNITVESKLEEGTTMTISFDQIGNEPGLNFEK